MIGKFNAESKSISVRDVDYDLFPLLWGTWLKKQKPFVGLYDLALSLHVVADRRSKARMVVMQLDPEIFRDGDVKVATTDPLGPSMSQQNIRDAWIGAKLPTRPGILEGIIKTQQDGVARSGLAIEMWLRRGVGSRLSINGS